MQRIERHPQSVARLCFQHRWGKPVIASLILSCCLLPSVAAAQESSPMRVYVGTYTRGDSQGIYTFTLDMETGKPSEPKLAAELANPSFVAISPDHQFLYCVNEVSDLPGPRGQKVGGVTSFKLDSETGDLTKLNNQLTGGAGPCHLVVDKTGSCLVVANYGGGSVASLPILEDGSLDAITSFIGHIGSSINPRRQEAPHAHSANIDANNKRVVVADLGLDKLLVYQLNPETGTLSPNSPPSVSTKPGDGPRHFCFHPNGNYAYSNNELSSSLTAYSYDPESGELSPLMTKSTLPDEGEFEGNSTAETLVHPSGKFVYVSNRGHNSIAGFRIQDDGTIEPIGHTSTQGEIPRNFGIDPTGTFLLAANQNSDTIVVFRISQEDGSLEPTGNVVNVPTPVCVRMIPAE
ncbi:6-phosphogluconolactonase [Thalassoglobus neptunius]|uniref:6-phosphogluconolactonase n=1 Tax=Thalassoglobus neptunius TaxID=1938619 RepID=A0A5C5X3T8_9PLAN|nr:lactonase family protein [Thalassoglobus neptunius]TWT56981.1 6-phosphogluconolactonase [Thalassoglobus neptunius]